jgi:AAA domain
MSAVRIDFSLVPVIDVARELLGRESTDRSTHDEKHFAGHAGLFVNTTKKNKWYSHGNEVGGDALNLVCFVKGCDPSAGISWLRSRGFIQNQASKLGPDPFKADGKSRIVKTYDYPDEVGELLHQVCRFEPKGFRQRRPDGSGGWIWSLGETRRVLYRLPEVLEAASQGRPIFIVEGEKAADALTALGVSATCSSGGAGKWRSEYAQYLAGAGDVIVLPDNDEAGERHAADIKNAIPPAKVLRLPGLPDKGDVADWIASGGTAEKLWELVKSEATTDPGKPQSRLRPLCIHRLFEIEIPKREMILDPIIPEKGLAMLYASRGIGKTHLACGISYAAATATSFLKWEVTTARKVLHYDGEMPADALRERFAQVMAGSEVKPELGMLNILPADLIEMGIGNLASPKLQEEMECVELLVLDNLSSLTSVIRDNDAESWNPIQEWLLRLRRRGVSVLIVHHAGKGGEQRGTSRREDVLDTSISLRRPSDYIAPQGARFEVHLEKARHGDRAKPFEAQLEIRDGAVLWTIREIEDVNLARVKALRWPDRSGDRGRDRHPEIDSQEGNRGLGLERGIAPCGLVGHAFALLSHAWDSPLFCPTARLSCPTALGQIFINHSNGLCVLSHCPIP